MRKILLATSFLMGVCLIFTTGLTASARQNTAGPLRWMVVCCSTEAGMPYTNRLYLVEPYIGQIQPLLPYFSWIDWLGEHEGWFYYSGNPVHNSPSTIYRQQLYGKPQELARDVMPNWQALSPDGQWLIFSHTYANAYHWSSHATQTGETYSLADGPMSETPPAEPFDFEAVFSPDSAWVAIELVNSSDGNISVWGAKLAGGALRNLTSNLAGDVRLVAWRPAPIGLVVFAENRLYSIDVATGQATPLSPPDAEILSPEVAWLENDQLAYLAQNFQVVSLKDGSLIWEEADVFNWSASPNGAWVLLNKNTGEVVMRRADGTGRYTVNLSLNLLNLEDSVAWAPDGATIFLVRSGLRDVARPEIWRMATATGELTQLASVEGHLFALDISPDGQQLVFGTEVDSTVRLFIMRPDGQDLITLPTPPMLLDHQLEAWGPRIDQTLHPAWLLGLGAAGIGLMLLIFAPAVLKKRKIQAIEKSKAMEK